MKLFRFSLFYWFCPFLKWFSFLFAFLFWVGCGGGSPSAPGAGTGTGPGGGGSSAAPGGINLPAPTADLEGGAPSEVNVCGTITGAPSGAVVRVTNLTNAGITPVEATLSAAGTFSLTVCIQATQTISVQVFDSSGAAVSPAQNITRTGAEPFNICPPPSNPFPACP